MWLFGNSSSTIFRKDLSMFVATLPLYGGLYHLLFQRPSLFTFLCLLLGFAGVLPFVVVSTVVKGFGVARHQSFSLIVGG